MRLSRPSQRRTFVIVVAACFLVGSFGLLGGGVSLLQLAIGTFVFGAWLVLGARRRRAEIARKRWIRAGLAFPHQAVTVRRLDG